MATWKSFERKMDVIMPADELDVVDALASLYAERIRQGLSQHDLAERMHIKQPQLAKIERMNSIPSLSTLYRYADGLGLKLKLVVTA